MPITCDSPYHGAQINGATFTILMASWFQYSDAVSGGAASWVIYDVEVKMPDGVPVSVPEWRNIKIDAGTGTPLEQAEANMVARLTMAGATNIVSV